MELKELCTKKKVIIGKKFVLKMDMLNSTVNAFIDLAANNLNLITEKIPRVENGTNLYKSLI